MRRAMPAEGPDINRAAGARILFGEPLFGNAHADASGIAVEMMANETGIAECGGHQDIGVAAAGHKITGHILAVIWIVPRLADAEHVLSRGGFVIDVAGVDVGSLFEKELCDFAGGREVQRGLAIAAASVYDLGVGCD